MSFWSRNVHSETLRPRLQTGVWSSGRSKTGHVPKLSETKGTESLKLKGLNGNSKVQWYIGWQTQEPSWFLIINKSMPHNDHNAPFVIFHQFLISHEANGARRPRPLVIWAPAWPRAGSSGVPWWCRDLPGTVDLPLLKLSIPMIKMIKRLSDVKWINWY